MWKAEELKTLVSERLNAAAEEIFNLFERTLKAHEEEVLRSVQEEQRRLSDWTAHEQPSVPDEATACKLELHDELTTMEQCEENQELPHIKKEQEVQLWTFQAEQQHVDPQLFNVITLQGIFKDEHSPLPSQEVEDEDSDCLADWPSLTVTPHCEASLPYNDSQISEETGETFRDNGGQNFDLDTEKTLRNVETVEQPHACSICWKSFSLKSLLNRHMKTHKGDKSYTCGASGTSIIQRSGLQAPVVSNSKQKLYTCRYCGKEFTHISNMNAHTHIHTGEKPFRCNECGKGFRLKTDLIIHAVVHTGERPYTCQVCNMKFSAQSNLIRHRKTHSGERPHCCTYCGKRFFRRSHLIVHTKTHKGNIL